MAAGWYTSLELGFGSEASGKAKIKVLANKTISIIIMIMISMICHINNDKCGMRFL